MHSRSSLFFVRSATCIVALAMLPAVVSSCKEDDPPPRGFIRGVRIMATRADMPYARPGETVALEALAYDGRLPPLNTEPMHVYWLPVPCINPPPTSQYYDCYPALKAAYPNLGVDLSPSLTDSKTTTLTIPTNALDNVKPTPGGSTELGATAFVFVVACGGHLERVADDGHLAVNQPPFACFSADHKMLDLDHFEFGFRRVSIFRERRNANPVITDVTFRNLSVDRSQGKGIKIGICKRDEWDIYWNFRECNQQWPFGVVFDDSSSSEPDPDAVDANGNVGRETIFVDYFTTIGRFTNDRRIVFDPFLGRPPKDTTFYIPWAGPGKGIAWAVLRDNRGGATWVELPIEIEP